MLKLVCAVDEAVERRGKIEWRVAAAGPSAGCDSSGARARRMKAALLVGRHFEAASKQLGDLAGGAALAGLDLDDGGEGNVDRRAASCSWVRSSSLRRCLSQAPNGSPGGGGRQGHGFIRPRLYHFLCKFLSSPLYPIFHYHRNQRNKRRLT